MISLNSVIFPLRALIPDIIEAIKSGMIHESMKAEINTLEASKTKLNALLAYATGHSAKCLGHLYEKDWIAHEGVKQERRTAGS